MNATSRPNAGHTCICDQELFFTLGIGTGAAAEQLLQLTSEDIKDGYISLPVGPVQVRRTFNLPEDVMEALKARNGRLFDAIPEGIDITDFLPLTMKQYYEETGDLAYPAHLMGSDSEETVRKNIG